MAKDGSYKDKGALIIGVDFSKPPEQPSAPRQPKRTLETVLQPLKHTPDVEKLIAEGKLPPGIKRWLYGRVLIMTVPEIGDRGVFIEMSRKDRPLEQREVKELAIKFVPVHIRMDAQIDTQLGEDGYYHAKVQAEKMSVDDLPEV